MFQKLSQFVTFIKLTVVSTAASRPSHGMPQCAWFDEKILHGYTFDIQYITNESIRVAASASSGVHSTSFIYNKQPNEGRSSQKKIPREKSNEERARKREKKIYCLLYMFRSHIYTLRRTAAHIVNISKWMEAADEILISTPIAWAMATTYSNFALLGSTPPRWSYLMLRPCRRRHAHAHVYDSGMCVRASHWRRCLMNMDSKFCGAKNAQLPKSIAHTHTDNLSQRAINSKDLQPTVYCYYVYK